MKLRNILFILAFVLTILLGTSVASAAGTSLTATSTNVQVGDSVTINASYTAASWDITVSGDGISGDIYVGYTEQLNEETTNKSFSLDTSKAGTYTIAMSGTITDENGVTIPVQDSVTVTVTEPAPTPDPDPVQPETPATDPGSTGSTTPSTRNSNGNTTTTGDNTSDNKKSSEATLSNLGIRPNDFTGFTRNKYEYDVEVPNDVAEVEVYATPRDSKAKVTGTGKVKLDVGENKLNVAVTAEDGTTKTYTINVTRAASEEENTDNTENPEETPAIEQPEEKTLALQTLSIKNVNLSPKFDPEKYEYTVGITEDLSSLDIEAKANEENATVEIIGNENLQQGENTITILVSNSETDESATYQITVNKNVKEEVVASTQFGTKQIILIVAVLVLIAIIVGAIIYKIRLSRNDEDDEIEFPGADELDKALAEHQELAEDDWQNKWEDSWNDDWQNEDDSEFGENGEQVQEDKANVLDSYIINKNAERKDKNNYKEDSKKQIDNHWSKNQNDENNDYHNSDNYSRRRGKHF